MSKIAIRVEQLSKCYQIGTAGGRRHDTLRDHLAQRFRSLFHRNGRDASGSHGDTIFWALQDMSFDIKEGDVVGIIGRNGAGKSTLLKILSRITKPTTGRAEIHGRVGSLLEVGTGFHPELTGRDNVYLNGAILGMKKEEIDRKFAEIIAFAGIERFVDTPVKRYSSGMYVRLAFAVAAHLEPEVMLVDEALAVGDTSFQKKCMGKMSDIASEGRTVLFVSHNMAAVQHLCNRVLLLEAGKVVFAGSPNETIDYYLSRSQEDSPMASHIMDLREGTHRYAKRHSSQNSNLGFNQQADNSRLARLEMYSKGNPFTGSLKVGEPLSINVSFHLEDPTPNFGVTLVFENNFGQRILDISTDYHRIEVPPEEQLAGEHSLLCDIPSLTLLPGQYSLSVALDVEGANVDRAENIVHINVEKSNYYGGGKLPDSGYLVLKHQWHHTAGLALASFGQSHLN